MPFKKEIKLFLVGSSLPMVLVTMLYMGLAFRRNGRPTDIPYEVVPIMVPLLFGLVSIANFRYKKYSLVIGALLGLTFSLIGRFGFGLPQKLFSFTKSNEYQVHFLAMILYALIFRFIVTPIQEYVFT
tara:strand:- start:65 stop:448 length:384 start_codon:yes stop_codon:yes gene_type:complete